MVHIPKIDEADDDLFDMSESGAIVLGCNETAKEVKMLPAHRCNEQPTHNVSNGILAHRIASVDWQ